MFVVGGKIGIDIAANKEIQDDAKNIYKLLKDRIESEIMGDADKKEAK
jgi:hypothetical protein